MQNTIQV